MIVGGRALAAAGAARYRVKPGDDRLAEGSIAGGKEPLGEGERKAGEGSTDRRDEEVAVHRSCDLQKR